MKLVSLATIPSGAVLDTAELAADKTFQDRGIRQTMHHPQVGDYVMSGWPVRFGGQTPAVKAAPLLGQHGEEVLADWLKLDKDKIGALRNDQVVA
jgi:formyl-CoA transferase